ncbi:uncharacterized protein LOC131357736 [Hemibagrus wyckioides]|uniref:uncharacterized protein LOC131357736 n=1 Tax=Hemibagrus wyckioides TaxID=337641 RepID=UPI00266D9D71|nr:uncharacterized protein LOC131357736 [Hemibagrus wyckioides]
MSFKGMAPLWIVLFLEIFPAYAEDFNPSSFVSVKSGERLTLNCTFRDQHSKELIIWYKQKFGQMPREVGNIRAHIDTQTSPEFSSGFKVDEILNGISLTMLRTKKADEGLYFCGVYTWGKFKFSNGTFVAVTDDRDVKVSVLQRAMSDSVPAGASVTLQCSVLSESRAAELQVLWFRAAPPQSHPQIIYTHHNSSHQCESGSSTHTCVYNFTKNILSLNDTGTYYCAVALCGKIVIGNGTPVHIGVNKFTEQRFKGSDSVVICLGVVLAVCVVANCAQVVLYCKKRNSKHCTVRHLQGSLMEKANNQGRDAVELNYAALNFSERKIQSGRAKKRHHQDTVYSDVTYTPAT